MERLHRTIADSFVAGLPGWTGGPRDHRERPDAAGAPLALAELVARFDRWVQSCNAERPHRALDGRTPLKRWTADPTPLRLIDQADARRLLTARRTARVRRDGVHHSGLAYIAVELTELVGPLKLVTEDSAACSFCGKTSRQGTHIVTGPHTLICDECVALSREIQEEEGYRRQTP